MHRCKLGAFGFARSVIPAIILSSIARRALFIAGAYRCCHWSKLGLFQLSLSLTWLTVRYENFGGRKSYRKTSVPVPCGHFID